ncbi:MAG: carboxyl-terminal processing protease [Cyclobacteriaceae bacterium]
MEENKNNNSKSAIRLPIYISAAIAFGIFIGANMADGSSPGVNTVYKGITKFRQVLSFIQNDYVDEVDTDELVETAITEMLTKLDPHSVYIPAKDLEMTNSQLEGNFEGIGIEFNIFHDTLHVISPLSGGPSESLGIKSGDKIVTVDGESVAGIGLTNRMVISMLRGPKGSKVVVMIQRKGSKELLEFIIERDVIPQYSVDVFYMIDEVTGYIKVNRFSATTYMEFKEGLTQLKLEGMENLILDLTGNPGGYMGQAVDLVDELIADNQMIVYTRGKDAKHDSEYLSNQKGDFETGPIIVLIDEGSASASEIVAGALQDHDRALVVGRRSYGKGLVQMPVELSDGSAMRLTISRYYTPSGRCIQKPYSKDLDSYHLEYYERFENGEVFSQDSIKVNDSLTFKTDKGRVVYGGGGIIPDFFVPLDTSKNSPYLVRLFNSNSIQEFSIRYYENHKDELAKWVFPDFQKSFIVDDIMVNDLIETGKLNGVSFNKISFQKSQILIKNYLKAYIARCLWKNNGFYPILNQENEIVLKALQLLPEANKLAKK